MKDVAISIINYNTAKYTIACIDSIITHTSKDLTFDIIVIDNNSEPNDFNYLRDNLQVQELSLIHISEPTRLV